MLTNPYPVPPSRWHTIILVLGWAIGGLAAPWILTFPPVTYEGLGLVASYGWGVMVGVGGLLIAFANAREEHRVEIVGRALATGGLAVYCILSWAQVIEGSAGSGSRALILIPFIAEMTARTVRLMAHHRRIGRMQRVARGTTDGDA